MSDTKTDVTADDKVTEQPPADGAPAGDKAGTGPEDKGGEENLDDLPEWARKAITKANTEAANYRTRLRDVETKFEGAKTAEEVEALRAELEAERVKVERERDITKALRAFELDDEDAKWIVGNTAEEITASAKAFAERLGSGEPKGLKGGLDPNDEDDDAGLSPGELAAKHGRRR